MRGEHAVARDPTAHHRRGSELSSEVVFDLLFTIIPSRALILFLRVPSSKDSIYLYKIVYATLKGTS